MRISFFKNFVNPSNCQIISGKITQFTQLHTNYEFHNHLLTLIFYFPNTMSLVPMDFSFSSITIRQFYYSDSFHLAPIAISVTLP